MPSVVSGPPISEPPGVLQGQLVWISSISNPPTPAHPTTEQQALRFPWALLNHLPSLHLLSVLVCCGLGSQVSPGFFEDESLCFCFVFSLLSWLLFSKGGQAAKTSQPLHLETRISFLLYCIRFRGMWINHMAGVDLLICLSH